MYIHIAVGSCFGHQMIAEALGGHVCQNPRGAYIVRAEELYPTGVCSISFLADRFLYIQ